MHGCGHDGHTTMLLGAAKYLAETRNFDGTVHFIFQPAEEGKGGAQKMVEEGLFDLFPVSEVWHAQLAGNAGRHHRGPHRPDHGGGGPVRHQGARQRRPWRHASLQHRPGAGQRPYRDGASVGRQPQHRSPALGGGQRHPDPWRFRL